MLGQSLSNDSTDLDDSGIGMSLVDDDMSMAKFAMSHDLVGTGMTVNGL
jgi:hypothetical protein